MKGYWPNRLRYTPNHIVPGVTQSTLLYRAKCFVDINTGSSEKVRVMCVSRSWARSPGGVWGFSGTGGDFCLSFLITSAPDGMIEAHGPAVGNVNDNTLQLTY